MMRLRIPVESQALLRDAFRGLVSPMLGIVFLFGAIAALHYEENLAPHIDVLAAKARTMMSF